MTNEAQNNMLDHYLVKRNYTSFVDEFTTLHNNNIVNITANHEQNNTYTMSIKFNKDDLELALRPNDGGYSKINTMKKALNKHGFYSTDNSLVYNRSGVQGPNFTKVSVASIISNKANTIINRKQKNKYDSDCTITQEDEDEDEDYYEPVYQANDETNKKAQDEDIIKAQDKDIIKAQDEDIIKAQDKDIIKAQNEASTNDEFKSNRNTHLINKFIRNKNISEDTYVKETKRFFNTLSYEIDRLVDHPYFPINKKAKHIEALLSIELNDGIDYKYS